MGALGDKSVNKCAINSMTTEIRHKRFRERLCRSQFKAAQPVKGSDSVNPDEKDFRRLIWDLRPISSAAGGWRSSRNEFKTRLRADGGFLRIRRRPLKSTFGLPSYYVIIFGRQYQRETVAARYDAHYGVWHRRVPVGRYEANRIKSLLGHAGASRTDTPWQRRVNRDEATDVSEINRYLDAQDTQSALSIWYVSGLSTRHQPTHADVFIFFPELLMERTSDSACRSVGYGAAVMRLQRQAASMRRSRRLKCWKRPVASCDVLRWVLDASDGACNGWQQRVMRSDDTALHTHACTRCNSPLRKRLWRSEPFMTRYRRLPMMRCTVTDSASFFSRLTAMSRIQYSLRGHSFNAAIFLPLYKAVARQ